MAASVNTTHSTPVGVQLYGPGDVLGFDARQVIRREPVPDSSDAEPNYFPLVEFVRPDLPWLFTPASPNVDRLRPWIVLVVVGKDEVSVDATSAALPVLHLSDAATELPDLAESWAWAHAQIGSPADLDDGTGSGALSRLVCPRRLDPGTRYLAAVVPAFELGRRAGLGLSVDDSATGTDPAWTSTTTALDLPMYLWWEFVTGQEGDFQALVTRLGRVNAGPTVSRPFTVTGLPAGLPDLGPWQLPGALGLAADPLPDAAFTGRLAELVNGAATPDLVLPPPFYAHWPVAVAALSTSAPPWLYRLNVDPRYRAAAAIGTRLVQEHQEDLMAAAWRQVGEIEAANRLLRQGQLARAAGSTIHRGLTGLTPAALLQLTAALHARVVVAGQTVRASIRASRVPAALVGGAARRALRPRGPLGRRTRVDPRDLIVGVNTGALRLYRAPATPAGLSTVDSAVGPGHLTLCQLTPAQLAAAEPYRHGAASPAQWDAFLKAASAHQQGMPGCEPPPMTVPPALDLDGLRTGLLAATDPATTVPRRLRARLSLPAGWTPADPLQPVLAAPRFDQPLYRDLVALGQEYLLPGVADVPANSVSAVPTNPRFVEAVLAGANHELARELLWRGFPTDQRGTSFRRFWDRVGSIGGPADDITAIDGWSGELGTHLAGGEQVVLLVRGEVLHRYPRTVVYAARAQSVDGVRVPVLPDPAADPAGPDYPERYPVFSGSIPPDLTFLGFALDPAEARGDPGWFFVFQQPPTEPRLGLKASSPESTQELSWSTVDVSGSGHIQLSGGLTGVTVPGWGVASTSAVLAGLTEQRPFRICIHASDLLPVATS